MRSSGSSLVQAAGKARLLAIRGHNFSGRTALLQKFCENPNDQRIYLGPEVYNCLSGLSTTVRQEIELHTAVALEASAVRRAVEVLDMRNLLNQHPGTLSGGEQASVAVVSGMAVRPQGMAVDCTLEQLDADRRGRVLSLLQGDDGPVQFSVVADNLLDEWGIPVVEIDVSEVRFTDPPPPPIPPIDLHPLVHVEPVTGQEIRISGLSAGYRSRPEVLRELTVVLQPGIIYVLEGLNGSGKTTWAKVLCGALRPSAGQIWIGGQIAYPWRAPRIIVGYHFQNPDVQLFESTVFAELCVGANASSGDEKTVSRRVECLIDAFGLRRHLDVNPLALPFPVRKRVAIAATLACGTPWVFLDEPTLGADTATTVALAEVVRILAETGHGVIVVSHSQTFKRLVNGVALRLHGGQIQL